MHHRTFASLLLLLLMSVLMFHCANPVTPEGGAKDISPPDVTECVPPNYSTRFISPDIHITFDEFVSLKSTSTEIFISPPLAVKPEYKLRGKTVIVDFKDTLAPNTTYIITFGKSILDITEGNILPDFRYVFSTGDYIDSLTISGKAITAFDNQPAAEVYAGLYLDNSDTIPFDSLPYLQSPVYITQTNKEGAFAFQNLHDGAYKLIVLDDQSGDFIYNMPAELVAFADSLVTPWYASPPKADTIQSDSLSAAEEEVPATAPTSPLLLRLFEEVDSTQEILKSELVTNGLFRISLKFPPRAPEVASLNIDSTVSWCIREVSRNRDTILLFTTTELPDTLILQVRDGADFIDTLTISPTRVIAEKKGKKKEEDQKPDRLLVSWKPRGIFNYLKNPLTGEVSFPVTRHDDSRIRLISGKDTVTPAVSFADSLQRHFRVNYAWKEASSYKIFIPDSTFFSYNGMTNDTIIQSFQTVTLRDLGSLAINVNMDNRPGNYIIQLLGEKEKVMEERSLSESGQIKFAFIVPAKYTIKAIYDTNGNGRWDTGDLLKKIQPENVFYFPKEIEIRGNWDVEEEWKL